MKTADKLWLVTLGILAVVAWLRNTRWWGEAADVLPILVALPLGAWLGKPWTFAESPFRLHQTTLGIGILLTVVGGFLSITLLLAAGWTCLLWAWLRERTPATEHARLRRILVFAFLAFPWVTLDLEAVGWWFRLSGAYVTAGLFKAIGFHVIHNGTELTIQGAPIAVTAACSGLKVLQSMLIAGSFLAHVLLGDTPRYWRHGIPPAYRSITLLLGVGLVLTLAGIILDIHAASHLGLIAILSAFGNRSRFAPLWWFSALAWIPLLTMAVKSLPPTAIYSLRISLALLGTTAVLLSPTPRTPATPTPPPTP